MRLSAFVGLLFLFSLPQSVVLAQTEAPASTVYDQSNIDPDAIVSRDTYGNRIGTSYRSQGANGEYFEHRDHQGRVTSYSRADSSYPNSSRMLHFDSNGRRVGFSETKPGFLGDQIVHYDQYGTRIGRTTVNQGVVREYGVNRGRTFPIVNFKPKSRPLGARLARRGIPMWVNLVFWDADKNASRQLEYAHYAKPWLDQVRVDLSDQNAIQFDRKFWRIGTEFTRALPLAHYGGIRSGSSADTLTSAPGVVIAEAMSLTRVSFNEVELVIKFHPPGGQTSNGVFNHFQLAITGASSPRLVKRQIVNGVDINDPMFFYKTGERLSEDVKRRNVVAYSKEGFRPYRSEYSEPIDDTDYSAIGTLAYNFNPVLNKLRDKNRQSITVSPGTDNRYKIRFRFNPGSWITDELMLEADVGGRIWRQTIIVAEPCTVHPVKLRDMVYADFSSIEFKMPNANVDEAFRHVYGSACIGVVGHYPSQTALATALGEY